MGNFFLNFILLDTKTRSIQVQAHDTFSIVSFAILRLISLLIILLRTPIFPFPPLSVVCLLDLSSHLLLFRLLEIVSFEDFLIDLRLLFLGTLVQTRLRLVRLELRLYKDHRYVVV